mgnify:CR=1 FL=1
MPKRLTKIEFHKKHSTVISLARQKLSVGEISRQTKHSPSMITYLITSARKRGIEIDYKHPTAKQKMSAKTKTLNDFKQKITDLKIHPARLRQAVELTAKYTTAEHLAQVYGKELNLPHSKAYALANLLLSRKKIKKSKQ